ncbi:iron-containing alcohol dehydrogenase [Desulfobulbus rhabdoformis]|uniref:iron-containing alcohol dehydrogenase n=1 Tax=Desulfobulbus rhabdoformis TaxID=34032 RepID=UPI00196507F6|nr:iron-containing alcohol dehydrogenase [Desulfobulbus rhabdoformis]MBM9616760.1 iron-containing alcohol dehydrogenase [Desulfobulbus rhabdoformis]
MHNFVFHNPTKILFGQSTLDSLGPETAAWGSKALLVYGQKSCKHNGVYDRVLQALQAAEITVVEHGGVQSNPLLSHARLGIERAKQEGIEVIVAVGGGSVLDTAKAIGAGTVVAHDVWKFFTGKKGVKGTLPVVTVPTLAASGSEMNSGMVLTNDQTLEKFGFGHRLLFPKVSILDPELTFSVPPDYTAFGAVDALSHVLEFYLTTQEPQPRVQDRLMEGLMENAISGCKRCLIDPLDYNARADLMWTSALALSGLTASGLGRVGFPMHLIEHSMSALFHVAHGAGLAVVMLGWLQAHLESHTARIAQLGRRVFKVTAGTELSAAQQTISALHDWLLAIGAPTTLEELDIAPGDIERLADNTRGLARIWRLREYTPTRVATILGFCTSNSHLAEGQEKNTLSP